MLHRGICFEITLIFPLEKHPLVPFPCPSKSVHFAPCGRLSSGHLLLKLCHWPRHLWLSQLLSLIFSSTDCKFFFLSETQTPGHRRVPLAVLLRLCFVAAGCMVVSLKAVSRSSAGVWSLLSAVACQSPCAIPASSAACP